MAVNMLCRGVGCIIALIERFIYLERVCGYFYDLFYRHFQWSQWVKLARVSERGE